MVEKKKAFHVSGKRKMAVARATIKSGTGVVRINNLNVDVFPNRIGRDKIREPLWLAGELAEKVNIDVIVFGGGVMAIAESARNAISKAMVKYFGDKALKKTYLDYDRHLLIADTRRTEPQKPCRSGARSSKQTSKR